MAELVILMGLGKCGKTIYAKKLERESGYRHISIDKHFAYNKGMDPWYDFVGYLVKLLNDNPSDNFVLDGYINACTDLITGARVYTGHGFSQIQEQLKYHTIKPVVVVISKDVFRQRKSKETDERIFWIYAWWLTMRGVNSIVLGSGANPEINSRDKAMAIVLGQDKPVSPALVGSEWILKKLKRRKVERAPHHGDPYYQTVELAGTALIQGYNRNYEHGTWNTIKGFLGIKGKSIGEVGCHHGFYLLKALEAGAKKAVGYDFNPHTVESATQIAHFRELDVNYHLLDIEKEDLSESFDVILVMNTFHHLKNPEAGLNKVFAKAKEKIFFETQLNPERHKKVAAKYSFVLTRKLGSKRPKRVILIFEKG